MAEPQHNETNAEVMNQLIDRLFHRREDIRRLEAELKGLKKQQTDLEHQILDLMDEQGLIKGGTELATISISEDEMPTVDPEHWEDVWNFCFENGFLELLRRQLNSTPWKELQKMGIEIPHVTSFTKRKLNMRAS